jgi:protoheme IX farnesyltransferase
MSVSVAVAEVRTSLLSRALAYGELTKPKIAVMVVVATAASACVATWGQPNPYLVLHALFGTLLVAGSSCAANQWLERSLDCLMPRTAERPLPDGRLSPAEAISFSLTLLVAGFAWLIVFVSPLTAWLALSTWLLYVVVYTPLKTRTSWNTAVGAIPGALPVLIGWTCVGGALDLRAAGLFLTLFLWQFPHFMAIAWLYRKQYDQAGFRMLPTVEPTGRWAGIQAIACAAVLLPVSLVPVLGAPGSGAIWYAVAAIILGLGQLACAVAFASSRTDASARRLLRASLVYLPVLLGCLVVLPGG